MKRKMHRTEGGCFTTFLDAFTHDRCGYVGVRRGHCPWGSAMSSRRLSCCGRDALLLCAFSRVKALELTRSGHGAER